MKPLDIEAIKHSSCLTEEQDKAVMWDTMCDAIVFVRTCVGIWEISSH
jgi:hypothetical protein